MVDTYDLFRKLSSGAKFDRKKLPKEITPFQVSMLKMTLYLVCELLCNQSKGSSFKDRHDSSVKDALDFFGDGPSVSTAKNDHVEQASLVTDIEKRRLRKRKRRDTCSSSSSDSDNASSAESGMNSITKKIEILFELCI